DGKRVLELNPEHAVVQKIQQIGEKDATDPRIELYARLLLDEELIAEGSKIKDPAGVCEADQCVDRGSLNSPKVIAVNLRASLLISSVHLPRRDIGNG